MYLAWEEKKKNKRPNEGPERTYRWVT